MYQPHPVPALFGSRDTSTLRTNGRRLSTPDSHTLTQRSPGWVNPPRNRVLRDSAPFVANAARTATALPRPDGTTVGEPVPPITSHGRGMRSLSTPDLATEAPSHRRRSATPHSRTVSSTPWSTIRDARMNMSSTPRASSLGSPRMETITPHDNGPRIVANRPTVA